MLKRLFLIFTIITIIAAGLFAQTGDTRVSSMGNAFTAVADDYNALYFNPAGLAFLDEKDFILGTTASAAVTNDFVYSLEETGPYPAVYEGYDPYSYNSYHYYEDEYGGEIAFDPEDFGYYYGFDQEYADYDEALMAYQTDQALYYIHSFMESMGDMQVTPRIAYVAPHWGISSISHVSLEPSVTSYDGEDTEYSFEVSVESGIMGGVGLNLAGIGVGANLKYYTREAGSYSIYASELDAGLTASDSETSLYDAENYIITSEGEGHLELGVGALVAMGAWSFGAYSDNILGFAEEDGSFALDSSFLDTLSVGAAFSPFNKKTAEKPGVLNFILAGDLKNLGDEEDRILALGGEAGIHLGNFLQLDGRVGYSQPLIGTLSEMSGNFDPQLALYSLGLGARFLFFSVDYAVQAPMESLSTSYAELEDWERDMLFGRFSIDASLVF